MYSLQNNRLRSRNLNGEGAIVSFIHQTMCFIDGATYSVANCPNPTDKGPSQTAVETKADDVVQVACQI